MKLPHRRQFLHLAVGAAALPGVSFKSWAQTYPSRPVRIVVGYPPGGAADISGRFIGQFLSERLRQLVQYSYPPQAITSLPSRRSVACIIAMSVEPRKIGEAAR